MGLQQFERRLERLVEGAFAKAFKGGLQPVELGRRLTREMDANRTLGVRGTIAPNHFTFELSPTDMERFGQFKDALVRDLANAARQHAKDEKYAFVGPVEVVLQEERSVSVGTFLLAGEVVAAPGGGVVGSLVLPDGGRIKVGENPVAIGRLPECDIVLADKNVSRRHAEVRRRDDRIVIVDLGSTNGTKVNGAGIKEKELADGDEIGLGSTRLRFETS